MKKYSLVFAPVFALLSLLLIVFWPLLTGGAFLNTGVIYSDMWLFNFPLKDLYREFLMAGKLPFWTSLVGNGYPVFAEGQVGALYPIHLLLFRFLPTLLAFNLNIFLHFFLAALFTYVFSRVSLKLSRPASFLAGIVYSLSGFFVTHIHQINILMVISYLPGLFMAVERFVSTKQIVWSFVLALIFALQIQAGHIEMFYYSVLLVFGFFVFITYLFGDGTSSKSGFKQLILLFLALVLAVGISAAQLLPTWELTGFSQRAEGLSIEAASATVWPFDALRLFVNPGVYDLYRSEPGYHPLTSTTVNIMALYGYVGIIPLILSLVAIVFWRKRFVIVFTIFLLGAFLYGFGRSTQLFAILWEVVPGLKFFRYPVKILFFIEFCLAILAAFGLDLIRKKLAERKLAFQAVVAFSLIVLGIVFVDLYSNNILRTRKLISGSDWLGAPESVEFIRDEVGGSNFGYRVYSHGTNNIDYQMARNPEAQLEFRNLLPADYNIIYRIPENREWFVLFLKRQSELNRQKTVLNTERASLELPEAFKKALALQSVRYLVADLPIEDEDLVKVQEIPFSREVDHYAYLMGSEGPVTVKVPARATYIYEYKDAYPRALVVPSARIVENAEDALEAVLQEDFDPREEVILEERVELEAGKTGKAKAAVVRDEQDSVEVSVETDASGFLVLSDTFYPGWTVEIDGKSSKIYRANYAFRAVPIEAGRHTVEFSYVPTHWRIGVWISAVAVVIGMVGLAYTWVRKS